MHFRTRAFLLSFVPLAVLLAISFGVTQHVVQSAVRDSVRASLRQNQLAMVRLQSRSDLQNNRLLGIAGDNAALKAGIELLSEDGDAPGARRTVEDQLLELGEHMGFDLLLVQAPNDSPVAGVIRDAPDAQLRPLAQSLPPPLKPGLLTVGDRIYQIASTPIDLGETNIGSLAIGKNFDLAAFDTPAILLRNGNPVQSSVPHTPLAELQSALGPCRDQAECTVKLHGDDWLSLTLPELTGTGGEYAVRSLEDVDAAVRPISIRLQRIFLFVAAASLLLTLLFNLVSSRSVVGPIADLVAHMRRAADTGVLDEYASRSSGIHELRELGNTYNQASAAVKQAREHLQGAYIEFVESLASALDARDPYTAGHSRRVSDFSCAIATELGLASEDIDRLRVGALLHDVGKIGIPDTILQKPGRLTEEEFGLIKQHPVIGRRILEGVQGFSRFLHAVELHHENWDGTGYPHRLAADEVPLDARIIHVADAYDAMTSNRSYRNGMAQEKALRILRENSGTQFDPRIVDAMHRIAPALHPQQADRAHLSLTEVA